MPSRLHRADHRRQHVADLVGAEPDDQRQPARLVLRIENVDQPQQLVDLGRRPAFQAQRIHDAAAELDMGVVGLAGAVADPDHVRRGRAPGAGMRRILARQRLLEAEQQRLVAGVEVGGLELRMPFEIEPAGLHEGERLGDAVGEFEIALRAARIEIEHPLMHAAEAGVAAVGEARESG